MKNETKTHKNDMKNIPLAACSGCGGWTAWGGCSQFSKSTTPEYGRTGCTQNIKGHVNGLNCWKGN